MKQHGWLSLFVFLYSISISHAALASNDLNLQQFVQGCSELVQIYNARGKQQFLAAQTTSLSEALRAGYCRGVIDSYKEQQNYYSCHAEWYEIAIFVSKQLGSENKFGDVVPLLERACK